MVCLKKTGPTKTRSDLWKKRQTLSRFNAMCFETHPIGLILDTMSCWMVFTTSRMLCSCAGQMAEVWRWQGLRCFLPWSTKETIWRMEGWLARTGAMGLSSSSQQSRCVFCFSGGIKEICLSFLMDSQCDMFTVSRCCFHILLRPHQPLSLESQVDLIMDSETQWGHMTLMHRYNNCYLLAI